MKRHAFAVAICICAASGWVTAQQGTFRSSKTYVFVNASVKKGNAPVANLTPADFTLTDNGVLQKVEALSIESIPVDVTLFLDTSGSTSGRLDDMKRSVRGILPLLRPEDRFRLLTIGDAVYTTVPWVSAGTTTVDLPFRPVGGISLVDDALTLALLHRPAADRRHLIIAMTDRDDCGSVVPSAMVKELAARTDSLLHIVDQSGSAFPNQDFRLRTCSPMSAPDGAENLAEAAARTGGEVHTGVFQNSSVLKVFTTVFADFRQAYILRYAPEGVASAGWHAITVTTPAIKGVTIRARQGYFGS